MIAVGDERLSASTTAPEVRLGPLTRRLAAGSVLYPNDIVSLSIVQQNARTATDRLGGHRGHAALPGSGDYVVQRGLGFELQTSRPDTTDRDLDLKRLAGAPSIFPTPSAWSTRPIATRGCSSTAPRGSIPPSASAAASLALPPVQLVYAYEARRRPRGV